MNENNNQNNNNQGPGPQKDPKNRQTLMIMLIATLITVLFMSYMSRMVTTASSQEISYSQFMQLVSQNKVESVIIEEDRIAITPKGDESDNSLTGLIQHVTYYTGLINDPNLVETLISNGVDVRSRIPDKSSVVISLILSYVLPLLIVWGLLYFFMHRMGGRGGRYGNPNPRVEAELKKNGGILFNSAGEQVDSYSPEQEKFDGGFILNCSIGKFIRLRHGKTLSINLSLSNVTNNTKLRTGGYEQNRGETNSDGNRRMYSFSNNPKYFYAYGFNAFLNIAYRF